MENTEVCYVIIDDKEYFFPEEAIFLDMEDKKNSYIEFKNDNDFVRFMNSPGDFIDNEDLVNKIKDLKELLNIMEDIYHV